MSVKRRSTVAVAPFRDLTPDVFRWNAAIAGSAAGSLPSSRPLRLRVADKSGAAGMHNSTADKR